MFRLAEDSDQMLDSYIDLGRVWVAVVDEGEMVGHIQAVPCDGWDRWEILNTRGRRGSTRHRTRAPAARLGSRRGAAGGARLVELATATADVGVLRFYQRCGFRMSRVVRDVFGPHNGYLRAIEVDGIALRDQVWFELDLGGVDPPSGGPTTSPVRLPGSVRFARPTLRLAECTAFYRDVLGLAVLFEFRDHGGYSGTVFALPDRFVQLELVDRADAASIPRPDPENGLVFYLRPADAVAEMRTRVRALGVDQVVLENPRCSGLLWVYFAGGGVGAFVGATCVGVAVALWRAGIHGSDPS
ncbi:MAG TPA: VOC family protein [Aldersonia sp.]